MMHSFEPNIFDAENCRLKKHDCAQESDDKIQPIYNLYALYAIQT